MLHTLGPSGATMYIEPFAKGLGLKWPIPPNAPHGRICMHHNQTRQQLYRKSTFTTCSKTWIRDPCQPFLPLPFPVSLLVVLTISCSAAMLPLH